MGSFGEQCLHFLKPVLKQISLRPPMQVRMLFERAVKASPKDALTRADYGRFLALAEKEPLKAEQNLREALHYDPNW